MPQYLVAIIAFSVWFEQRSCLPQLSLCGQCKNGSGRRGFSQCPTICYRYLFKLFKLFKLVKLVVIDQSSFRVAYVYILVPDL